MTSRISILLLTLFYCLLSQAQDPTRKHSLGLYQNFTDYNVELLNNKIVAFDSSLSLSNRIAYQRRWSPTWMLNTGITNGFILNQEVKDNFAKKAYAIGADAAIIFKFNNGRFMKENPFLAPFLTFGYRVDHINKLKDFNESPWLMSNQYGLGFHVRLSNRTHVQALAALDQKLLADFNTHMMYRVGITQSLGKFDEPKRDKKLDSDFDGIVDLKDDCPGKFGLKELNGCPDTTFVASTVGVDSLKEELMVKENEIELLKTRLEESKNRSQGKGESRVDTVYYEQKVVVKEIDTVFQTKTVVEEDASLRRENERLAQEKKRLEDLLAKQSSTSQSTTQPSENYNTDNSTTVKVTEPVIETSETKVVEALPEDKNYYVITMSSPNISTANRWLSKMKRDFPNARIIPQENGYYRVGVYVGKDKQEGLAILDRVKLVGYNPAWLSVE